MNHPDARPITTVALAVVRRFFLGNEAAAPALEALRASAATIPRERIRVRVSNAAARPPFDDLASAALASRHEGA